MIHESPNSWNGPQRRWWLQAKTLVFVQHLPWKLLRPLDTHLSTPASQVEAALEALSSVDDVSVVTSGDASNAYDFGWVEDHR